MHKKGNELKKPSRLMVIKLSTITLCLHFCTAFPLTKSEKKQHLADITTDDLASAVLKITYSEDFTYSELVVHLVRRFLPVI